MPLSLVSRRDSSRPVLILDLDGTLLDTNSFPHWARHLARARFSHLGPARRLAISLAVIAALARRRLGLLDHAMFKWRLQQIWQRAVRGDDGAAERQVIAALRRYVRPQFASLLAGISAGTMDAVLATAAAGDYAVGLGRELGFRHVLATSILRDAPRGGNIGRQKRDAVLQWLVDQGWQGRPLIFFTDHVDDLPLIRISQTTYWFGSDNMRQRIVQDMPQTDLRPGFRNTDEFAFST